jgi:hypothetical protein
MLIDACSSNVLERLTVFRFGYEFTVTPHYSAAHESRVLTEQAAVLSAAIAKQSTGSSSFFLSTSLVRIRISCDNRVSNGSDKQEQRFLQSVLVLTLLASLEPLTRTLKHLFVYSHRTSAIGTQGRPVFPCNWLSW